MCILCVGYYSLINTCTFSCSGFIFRSSTLLLPAILSLSRLCCSSFFLLTVNRPFAFEDVRKKGPPLLLKRFLSFYSPFFGRDVYIVPSIICWEQSSTQSSASQHAPEVLLSPPAMFVIVYVTWIWNTRGFWFPFRLSQSICCFFGVIFSLVRPFLFHSALPAARGALMIRWI